ncbi:four helix bundle protein [Rubrivirga sp.]|uniref:four helix bundle protein n=1 Tax=Rubrivirga sp. TaxID=1885344 RepID=UPI003B52AE48
MVTTFRELRVYQAARRLAGEIYGLSKEWPREERYSLTDQIRRSSRSVGANVAEAWRKRRYPKHFVSKLTDADAEAAETQAWLDAALDCGLIDADTHARLDREYDQVLGSLVRMMRGADRWCGPATLREPPIDYDTDDYDEFYGDDGFYDRPVNDPDPVADDPPPLYVNERGHPLDPSHTPIPPHPDTPQ